MINWKVRIKNKVFWVTFIPAMLALVSAVATLFGITLDLSALADKLLNVVECVFGVLILFGIVADPTTKGLSDSENALTYNEPK